MMNMSTTITQKQQQQLSATQIQSLNILAMPAEALRDVLQKESEENPFMEYQPVSSSHDGTAEFLNFIAAPEKDTVKNFILEQLNPQRYSHLQWALLSYLADCVDDKGFLTVTETELTSKFPLPAGLFTGCLKILQQLEPAGICAFDLEDCLKLQLQRKGKLTPLLIHLIEHHLKDIAVNTTSSLCRLSGVSKKELIPALQLIKSLTASPLKGFCNNTASYIVPDVIIRKTPEGHEVVLNDSWIASYSISDYYVHMMHNTSDPTMKDYFQNKYTRSYLLLHNVERRRQTLLALTNAIWDWQYDYIQKHHTLRPMTLKNIAETTGLHISTISRSTKDKYLQLPWRTVSFKSLFQRSLPQKDGTGISHLTINKALLTLIHEEIPSNPYSDSQLLQLLKNRFRLTVSRRVIQKYRNSLGILNSYERRQT
jgi:RNA polymerase sigma-54 factor